MPIDWQHEDEHDKGYLDAFRMQGKEPTRVKLEMTLRAKNLLCEEFPLAEPDITEKDGKYILDTKVSKMEGVGRFVIGLMGDIRVLDSPELEKYVQEYVQKNMIGTMTNI